MADNDPDLSADPRSRLKRSARGLRLAVAAAAGLVLVAIGLAWLDRIAIAQQLIDRKIAQLKLSARYRVDAIGPRREMLSDVSIGDPSAPDLFIKTVEIDTGWSGGLPGVTQLTLTGTRLRGRYDHGRFSFGSLDPIILAPSPVPLRLPDMALTLRNSQASIGGDHGPIGFDLRGDGNLRDGFVGAVAIVAPLLRGGGCAAQAANFHGQIAVHDEQPRIIGPLRMAQLTCEGSALAAQVPHLQLDMRLDPSLDGGAGQFGLNTGAVRLGYQGAARLGGSGYASLRSGALATRFSLGGTSIYGPSIKAAQLGIAGQLHATTRLDAIGGDGTLSGRGIAPDASASAALAHAQAATAGTLMAPLLAAMRDGVAHEAAGSRLSGRWTFRRSAYGTSVVLPEAHLDGGRTAHWLALSRVMLKQSQGPGRRAVAASFALAAKGFPQLHGQIKPIADGGEAATLAMPAWVAATSSLAVPILSVRWLRDGRLGFDGSAIASGPVPGGQVTTLRVPLAGSWSAAGGLLVGSHCTPLMFDRLTVGGLDLGSGRAKTQALTVCPGVGASAILALGAHGLRIAARTAGLQLDGRMQGSVLNLASGAAALTWPGGLSVENIDVTAKNATAAASHLHLAQLAANLGATTLGHFAGGDVSVGATPIALRSASGDFGWANGRLTVDRAQFRVEDPSPHPNFVPIVADQATLALADGVIDGSASLRATAADRELARVAIVHDLASSTGHADVSIRGLMFDKTLQPKQLSALIEGVIADARGTLTGDGRLDWANGHVTSHGRVSTTGFDFAAPFGPVQGVSGEVVFTDLLRLVTAPDQTLAIATINPGIEVDGGTLIFALQPGYVLAVKGAHWPFLDGRLTLLPTRLVLGATEVRRYELRVDGLNAAKFLARMDLSNLAATGVFDGNLPLVFDQNGGRIEQGLLLSRPPGGTVSYVGDLTYKDLSPMANYAFQALRALQYHQMRIAMDGAIAGDIRTRVTMSGVGQGKGAKRNFITSQLARLPIQFDVNITAPFMQLVTSFRSLYDPALLADPRALGLIDATGKPIAHPAPGNLPAAKLPPAIQP